MCLRAVFKISEHALVNFHSGSPDIVPMLAALAVRALRVLDAPVAACSHTFIHSGLTTAASAVPRRRLACC